MHLRFRQNLALNDVSEETKLAQGIEPGSPGFNHQHLYDTFQSGLGLLGTPRKPPGPIQLAHWEQQKSFLSKNYSTIPSTATSSRIRVMFQVTKTFKCFAICQGEEKETLLQSLLGLKKIAKLFCAFVSKLLKRFRNK